MRHLARLMGLLACILIALPAAQAIAQPADLPIPPARADAVLPQGVAINTRAAVPIYTDASGRTLYGMDMRTVLRWSANAALYCRDTCLDDWQPLLAPPGTAVNIAFPRGFSAEQLQNAGSLIDNRTAPDWTVIEGPAGPQWVYKGWHLVFTRKGEAAGSARYDGADGFIWNSLKYVPPLPQVTAPPGITASLVGGRHVLTDADGNRLVTSRCSGGCAGLTPLAGGFASRGIAGWQIDTASETPQWTHDGKPVFILPGGKDAALPQGATEIMP